MTIRKPLLFTAIVAVAAAAISAYVNLSSQGAVDTVAQPHWIVRLHIVSAFVGALLLAKYIVTGPAALQGPTEKSSYGVGMVPRVGAVRSFSRGKNGFFSATRNLQLIGIALCLMVQFISVAETTRTDRPDPHERPARMNAADGTLAT
ncbi:hypothetical protein EVC45_17650 [Paraburkholderia sp. UYCP14C]|uniref:hypothetical protein n=1 Tax=Paraburkholderia sp. UYCP14C TaxID=2511130 RepID=UPI00102234D8|nr:hypothetical protein [Paraburkholderia sp. UYCP14C]RZF28403.1 hypothetical protein EVC45_17650 [Paraburkholderia sp. UYCP14C]